MAKLSGGSIEIKVHVDTEEAVKTLKNLQRTARETVKVLKEAEKSSKELNFNMTNDISRTKLDQTIRGYLTELGFNIL